VIVSVLPLPSVTLAVTVTSPAVEPSVSVVCAWPLASVVAVVDPELIVLGGGIGRAPGLTEAVAEHLARLSPAVPEVRATALGDDAVVDGCIAVGTEELWQRVLRSRGALRG